MAFKNVNQRFNIEGKLALTELAIGASFTGHLLSVKKYFSEEYDREMISLLFKAEDGKTTVVYPAGNVKYMIQDGKLTIGQNTRITRRSDTKVKGKKSTNFAVEQDPDDTVNVDEVLASVSAASSVTDSESAADDGEETTTKSSGGGGGSTSRSEAKRQAVLAKEKRLQEGA